MLKLDILTLFPGMFSGPFEESIIKRARGAGIVVIDLVDLRKFAKDRHGTVDDRTFGGGPGMVLKPDVVFEAIESLVPELRPPEPGAAAADAAVAADADSATDTRRAIASPDAEVLAPVGASAEPLSRLPRGTRIILTDPQGRRFDQALANELAGESHLVILCGHYEGVDERVREHIITDALSIGDVVLTGGELPAMVMTDAIVRLLPGAVGKADSPREDSFYHGVLDYPHYTRPADFRGWKVPEDLVSGHHGEVARWRRLQALERTLRHRPDLLESAPLSAQDRKILAALGYRPQSQNSS